MIYDICINIYMSTCTFICLNMYMYIYMYYTYVCEYAYGYVDIHIYTYIYIYMCVCTYVYMGGVPRQQVPHLRRHRSRRGILGEGHFTDILAQRFKTLETEKYQDVSFD